MRDLYRVDYTIFFFEDMDSVQGSIDITANFPEVAAMKVEQLFDTNETTTRINSVDFIA